LASLTAFRYPNPRLDTSCPMRRWGATAFCGLLLPQGGQALAAPGDALGNPLDGEERGDDAMRLAVPFFAMEVEPLGDLTGEVDDVDDRVYVSSFVSDNGLLCTEGPGRHIAAHLATYKASPLGGAYQESTATFNVSCRARGYGEGRAPDACSGSGRLSLSVRKAEDTAGIEEARRGVLDRWRGRHRVNGTLGTLLAACSCHPRSEIYQARQQECESLESPGSWLHVTKVTASSVPTYACYEGPFEYALRALATMKSTPFFVVHEADEIIPKGCRELGYSSRVGVMDRCFTRLRLMKAGGAAAKAAGGDAQHGQALAWTTSSYHVHIPDFDKMAKDKNLDAWDFGAQVNGCHCSPKSLVFQGLKSKKTRCGFPPVRDYWKG